jgi:hypothetical protein
MNVLASGFRKIWIGKHTPWKVFYVWLVVGYLFPHICHSVIYVLGMNDLILSVLNSLYFGWYRLYIIATIFMMAVVTLVLVKNIKCKVQKQRSTWACAFLFAFLLVFILSFVLMFLIGVL